MRIPKKVEIDHFTFKVIQTPGETINVRRGAKRRRLFGEGDSRLQRIRIAKRQPKDEKGDTLLHEIIHLCAIRENIKLYESQVSRLSSRLYQVLKHNKLKFY